MIMKNIQRAKQEAIRFLDRVENIEYSLSDKPKSFLIFASKESGALRRASMDLTRALAEMRRPD